MPVFVAAYADHHRGSVGIRTVAGQDGLHGRFGFGLQSDVHRGVYVESALKEQSGAILAGGAEHRIAQEPLLHILHEVGGRVLLLKDRHILYKHQRLRHRGFIFFGADELIGQHPL